MLLIFVMEHHYRKVFAFNTKLHFITRGCNECSTSVRSLRTSSEESLLHAGTNCSHLLAASWSLLFVPLAFAFFTVLPSKIVLL